METTHEIRVSDARSLDAIDDDSVHLVVTSPPYPMIEMWDDVFASLDDDIDAALDDDDGDLAFELMHNVLDDVWAEVERVLVPGGIACINVGDATRTLTGEFELYPNHAAVIERFRERGFQSLPTIHWRKPTNKKTKFMGSGMIPPNAYVTLEHESILVFRNGGKRSFEAGADCRYEAAYFWEERNRWFTDTWTDVAGETQSLDSDARDRAAAYPFEIPYRLINMYSVYGDTVLDPFLGTGTTSLAAATSARNSVGYEIDAEIAGAARERIRDAPEVAQRKARNRLDEHYKFATEEDCNYDALHYATRVKTKQERNIRFYVPEVVRETTTGYRLQHEPYESE